MVYVSGQSIRIWVPLFDVNGAPITDASDSDFSESIDHETPDGILAEATIGIWTHRASGRYSAMISNAAVGRYSGTITFAGPPVQVFSWECEVETAQQADPVAAVGLTSARVAKLDRIGSSTVLASSPVDDGGRLTLRIGDDYNTELGNEPTWSYTGPIDLTGATVTLAILSRSVEIEIACAVQDPGEATQTITAELTSEQTATLRQSQVTRYVVSMVDGDDEATLFAGKVTVLAS